MLSSSTGSDDELPPVDARLVARGSRYEIYDGELFYVAHSDELRGSRLSKLSTLMEIHASPEFCVVFRMLTRTSETSDIAADVSVFPREPDPKTGGRQLEQLAFDVVTIASLDHAARKAAKLVARGVRRVFAINIERERMLEWSSGSASWRALEQGTRIEDPALAVPLPIEPLLCDGKVDDAVQRALILTRNQVFEAHRLELLAYVTQHVGAEGAQAERVEHVWEWLVDLLLRVLAAHDIALDDTDTARVSRERDPQRFERWFARARICTSIADVFAER